MAVRTPDVRPRGYRTEPEIRRFSVFFRFSVFVPKTNEGNHGLLWSGPGDFARRAANAFAPAQRYVIYFSCFEISTSFLTRFYYSYTQ